MIKRYLATKFAVLITVEKCMAIQVSGSEKSAHTPVLKNTPVLPDHGTPFSLAEPFP
jgi:hypothetical protein